MNARSAHVVSTKLQLYHQGIQQSMRPQRKVLVMVCHIDACQSPKILAVLSVSPQPDNLQHQVNTTSRSKALGKGFCALLLLPVS